LTLEVYFREDIRQGIVAVAVAMLSTAVAHGSGNVEYCRGILDASRAQALNYGLPWSSVLVDIQGELTGVGRADLLEFITRVLPEEP
jgi:hypothetical protein